MHSLNYPIFGGMRLKRWGLNTASFSFYYMDICRRLVNARETWRIMERSTSLIFYLTEVSMKNILKYTMTFLGVYVLAFIAVKICAGALVTATSPAGALAVLLTIGYIYWNEQKKKEKNEKEEKR